jgi:hypothetical protein
VQAFVLRRVPWAFAVCLAALVATGAAAQVGGITVVVTDPEGAPLPGAAVTISHETAYVKTTTDTTDKQGVVRFPVLRPGGGYEIQVSFPSFSPIRYNDVRVRLHEQQTLRVQMIEEVREQVRVTVDRDVVDLDKTETSTKFSADFIADLPVLDRFYQNILVMAPGVQDANLDGSPNVHGSRTRDFQALVSGVSNVDPLTGQWLSRINPNSIEEMEIITAGAGVEFGRAQGGFARIIQKQGSNTHEGVVEVYYQTSDLDGRGASGLSDLPDPEFETVQPGFQFSGPIVRDKLWYRASYERRDREEPVFVLSGIDVYADDSETRDAQITWQASPRNKLALRYRSDPAEAMNFGISRRIPPESTQSRDRDSDTWTLSWIAPYSPKVLVENTVAWQEVDTAVAPSLRGVPNSCIPSYVLGFLRDAQCLDLTIDRFSGSFTEDSADRRQRFTVKSQATVYAGRLWGANHQIKLGFNVENERYFRNLRRTPTITYEEFVPLFGLPYAVVTADLDVPGEDRVRATGTNWAIYAEDQLKPSLDLTITIGARVDREELNSEGRRPLDPADELRAYEASVGINDFGAWELGDWRPYFTGYEAFRTYEEQLASILCDGLPANEVENCTVIVKSSVLSQLQEELTATRLTTGTNISNTNLSPFLSVAWSPWSNGKTAFKASAGRHYNNIPLVVPLEELQPVKTSIEYLDTLGEEFYPRLWGTISPNISVGTVDHGLHTPYQDELTLSFERELWPETSIHLTYISRRFRDQLQDRNINVGVADYGVCAGFADQLQLETWLLPVLASPGGGEGSGQFVVHPWTGEIYEDTDEGIGDGYVDPATGSRYDNCSGARYGFFGIIHQPDDSTDLYFQNPFWGDILEVGNVNEIDYEAFVLELARRRYRNWEMDASYTWSEAVGDGEDFFQELGNDPSRRDDVRGFQSYDQRHVVKLNAATVTSWGIRLGTAVTWQSGLPYSIVRERLSEDVLPPSTAIFATPGTRVRLSYPTGARNDQRNKSYWNIDVKVTKEIRFGQRSSLQASAEVFNVLDDETYLIYNPFFEAGQRVNGVNEAQRRFGRRWQVGLRLAF